VIDWYREQLVRPAVFPWAGTGVEPLLLGPTWRTDKGRWVLPDATIGWDVLGFAGCWLQHRRGVPWRFTLEQARFVLWWYAVDEHGRWLFDDGVIQRLKGWGKDPLLAVLCANELVGPARFLGWDRGLPVAGDVEDAWVPVAATALAQTKTTFRLFPGLFSPEAVDEFGIVPGKEMVYAYGDARMIQAVTSSPTVLEGIRSSFTVRNETQHWLASNAGHDMADVIERNSVKSVDGAARVLAATNAPDPSTDSVGMRDREAWEDADAAGSTEGSRILYDSVEAPADAGLSVAEAQRVLQAVRGDSVWLDVDRVVRSILDPRNPPSRSRRFWFNQLHAAEDAWVSPIEFGPLARPELGRGRDLLMAEERAAGRWVVFFDGSKSDDATGMVGCRLEDGHVVTLGMWQRPPKARGDGWLAPRAEIDERMADVFARLEVIGLWADPSHTRDDETQERYWDDLIDGWHRRWRGQLQLWAVPGKGGHSVMWDMTSPSRSAEFTAAAMRTTAEISAGQLSWDGDARLRIHVLNARRYPNRWGVSLWKGARESRRKIDLAVCMVGARMMRRAALNETERPDKQGKRPGRVW
jgi:hypothetical protein